MPSLARTTGRLLAAASLLALWPAAVFAEAPAAAADAAVAAEPVLSADTDQLGDIVVTGEKRETRLQDAPIAITSISGDALTSRNINGLVDMSAYVPGLNITQNQGSERVITIRGIGYETSSNPNSQPGVAFHIDGVYIAHTMSLAQDLLDVDRVEVLRGPQGTVFGITSTGGAINLITKKPVIGEASASGALSYGNYNYVKATGTINLPISATLAIRANAQWNSHDSYGHGFLSNARTDRYGLDNARKFGGRASLIWTPSDTFTALLEGQLFTQDNQGALQKSVTDTTPGKRNVTQDFPGTFELDTRMIYLTLSQELGENVIAKSITAYQFMLKNQTGESDRTADPTIFDHLVRWRDRSKTFTQEISLSSQNSTNFEWTVGGIYLRQRAVQDIYELSAPGIAAIVLPDGTGVKFQTDSPYQHTSWGGYGQATFRATDALSLTAGLRYSWDKVDAQPFQFFQLITGRSAKSDALTGKVGVEYKVTPENLLYATASRGYKPTGVSFVSGAPFVPGSFSSGPQFVPATFKKETINALEIGSKNDFFDNKVRLNAAGYYYWYKNFQYTAEDPVPFAGGTDNIPKAEIYGIEFEGSVLPVPGLRFDGTFSAGKGKFKSDYLIIDAQTAAAVRFRTFQALGFPAGFFYDARIEAAVSAARQNANGKRLPKMPGVQGTFSATYTADLGSGELSIRGDLVHRGKYNYRVFAVAADDRLPAYTIYNGFIQYAPQDQPWRVSFSAQNIFNKAALLSRFADPYGSGTTSVEYIPPRQVFGTVAFDF